jgi:H+-transporting ATPase
VRALSHGSLQELLGMSTPQQLQTMMFLQLVVGGHLLLLVTRTERWFFLPPFPAARLFIAIVITQILAVALCYFGWLVPAIPLRLIGFVWLYCLAFMFVLGFVRKICERFAAGRTVRETKSVEVVQRPLAPHPVAAQVRSPS